MANINEFKDKVDEDELAKITRELENSVLGVKGNPSEHFSNKIQALRDRRESVENNLEAEAYTAEALHELIDAQNTSRSMENKPSDVEGISQSDLESLQNEARSTFAPAVKRAATSQHVSTEPSHEELNRDVALHPSKVGINALMKDIEKSEMDPSKGIRDFYNKVYSEHGDKRLRDKENYLNLPITGDLQKARNGLSKFDELNGFNSSALDTLNDGVISAMRDLHKEEREKNPKDVELRKRHAAEEALFSFRESSEKLQDNTPQTMQAHKDSLRDVLITHTQYAEQRWGRQLNAKDRPSVNEELEKYQLGLRAPKANAPTLLQDVKQAQVIQKSKLQMKIGMHR
jgi:phage gp46-like protein